MRPLLAWLLFGLGHITALADRRLGRTGLSIYPLYRWLMLWSNEVQGTSKGPWGPPVHADLWAAKSLRQKRANRE